MNVTASGGVDFKKVPCSILSGVFAAITAIAGTMMVIMFVYGGVKYVYSADDPGGRNGGKNICIQALIGGIIVSLWAGVSSLLPTSGWSSGCI
jgi:hypothetical protein